MKSPFKMKPGRSNMPKTGRDIPLNMKSPAYMTDPDPKTGKAKIGEYPTLSELKSRFKNQTVVPKKGKKHEYSLIDSSGNTVSYKSSPKKEDKSVTFEEGMNKILKDEKSGK